MKHEMRFLLCSFFAAIPLFLFSGCYTQVGAARGDVDEGYDSRTAGNDQIAESDQTAGDSTQPGDYDSARREFYNDSYYPSDYPAYSVGIGYGWRTPWFGYGYPWYFYDGYPYYGGFYPFAFGFNTADTTATGEGSHPMEGDTPRGDTVWRVREADHGVGILRRQVAAWFRRCRPDARER